MSFPPQSHSPFISLARQHAAGSTILHNEVPWQQTCRSTVRALGLDVSSHRLCGDSRLPHLNLGIHHCPFKCLPLQ